ncbi:Arginine dimethylating methyltransferase [Komagataella phaffii CBS 7435]|uniref:Nuclear SAM-dependent mono-and asymmetric arginine dimethylating methyltransferase n=2 Tax=Komagataella phaffii TaxID=460519 RepID=C4QV15_KOMPG|nr:Nuclear SAM-dependent mono-and asymmetric arginine dimethylating methyltransferase [Komagataella phaffii GS115]AOA60353.1 GQ67_02283T0 [Komagataella phaffii]CAH2445738.1 Arginine dimethylating methyltransferase [Komagataella phaffii CBS 7435]AOA66295.1 GQ68_02964T0 [Komagataella phaffii GS115]CAY67085.1 Nuclear SAM-dependent mono-and asymmetric arginine dimethylating methyltransferase [Komagataella phaffii GS115]CCA36198.1 Arginine dimethylating methyltransferase [Komagataella phaffii CBS 7
MSSHKDYATDKKSLPFSEQHYFSSYDHFGIHEEMLKDQVRTISYRSAILKNKANFKDKIVLDVGCGTGILSMFAARAGAKHVIAVDMSNIADMAEKIVELNGFSDKITVLKGKLEDVELPYPEVDIIISEWMGYFLLYESMLDTVLVARDKYLKEGGLIFPDKASIHVAAIEDGNYKNDKIHYWENVYGFDYSPFIEIAMSEPLVDTVENGSVVTTSSKLIEFDLNTVTLEDLAFHRDFSITATRDELVHAYIAWFDIEFPGDTEKVVFSTGPHAHYTHWKQTVFYMNQVLDVKRGETITGSMASRPNVSNPRELDIELQWDFQGLGASDPRAKHGKYNYFLR